jgi:riboflavin synthase
MFTGIVLAIGRVVEAGHGRLRIAAPDIAHTLAVGGSIAVNGACLTVVERDEESFTADVVPETARRTNLGDLSAGDQVNLEPPLTLQTPLDGHLVQGHVDATAAVTAEQPAATGRELAIELPPQLRPFVAEKGSIAVDGTSLTVAQLTDTAFTVALIPHTLEHTIAGAYRPGSKVNLEVDLLARYVARLARPGI